MKEFYIQLRFIKNDLWSEIVVKRSISSNEFELFKDIVNKTKIKAEIEDINFTPIASFMKNKEIDFLIKQDWKVDDINFVISEDELLIYYKNQKENGGKLDHAHDVMFSHVSINKLHVTNFQLMIKNKIVSCSMSDCSNGYIIPKYKDKHDKIIRNKKKYIKEIKNPHKIEQLFRKPKITLTKSECRKCRNNIIKKAKTSNICSAGFKPDFTKTLSVNEQAYLEKLSNLQIKFMINAITKK